MSFEFDLRKFAHKLQVESPETIKEMGDDMFKSVKDLTPVDTGYAKSRWKKETRPDEIIISNDADYIEALENGHSEQAPHGMVKVTMAKTKQEVKIGKYTI